MQEADSNKQNKHEMRMRMLLFLFSAARAFYSIGDDLKAH